MLNRRTILQGLGGATLAANTPAWSAGHSLDLNKRADFLTAIAKMRGSTDDQLVIGYVIGARYAVVDYQAIPMMGILAGTFSRYRRLDAETFEARSIEVAYFTDMQTGKLLETWDNPVTGKRVEVQRTRMGPSTILMTADGLQVDAVGGIRLEHFFRPAVEQAGEVWITEEIRVNSRPPDRKPFVYNEMTTYQANRADLNDPQQAAVPTRVQYTSVITFRDWMGFGDTEGLTNARGIGRRAARVEDLPPYYLELTERYHPDVLNDPLAVLAADS